VDAAGSSAVASAPAPAPATATEPAPVAEVSVPAREPDLAAEAGLDMTPALWSELRHVNDEINRSIVSRSDEATYGVVDYWNTPLEDGRRAGDCEDYVLEKRHALLAAGVPGRALNIALVTTRRGESHAVLLVTTRQGELVLDNLSPWIVPWNQAGYQWVERQVDGEPFKWAMVNDPTRERLFRMALRRELSLRY
jgi:predicted transglutaminase-like cysteine proteinase